MLRGRRGPDDAALLPLRRHGEHGLAHGVDRRALAHPHEPDDARPAHQGWRLLHRVPGQN